MTEFGNLALIDQDAAEESGVAIPLPGVKKGEQKTPRPPWARPSQAALLTRFSWVTAALVPCRAVPVGIRAFAAHVVSCWSPGCGVIRCVLLHGPRLQRALWARPALGPAIPRVGHKEDSCLGADSLGSLRGLRASPGQGQ